MNSQKTPFEAIEYLHPDIPSLNTEGYVLYDMHLHTKHSDGLASVGKLIKYIKDKQIHVAITDHNVISGVLEAEKCMKTCTEDAPYIVPGIELETKEGPHVLLYFYTTGDLEDFYDEFSQARLKICRKMRKPLPILDSLIIAEQYDCLRVAAHPYGYYGIDRGVLKCVEQKKLPCIMDHINGVEAICGGMPRGLNMKSIAYAKRTTMPFTGGSDAHVLDSIGDVVTGTYETTSVEEHLNAIKKRQNIVIGKSENPIHKGISAGAIAWNLIPFVQYYLSDHYKAEGRILREKVKENNKKNNGQ